MKHCLIDISNIVHRAKHSMANAAHTARVNDPFADDHTIVETDSIRMGLIISTVMFGIMAAFSKFHADHCVAAFDRRSWRKLVYENYKAGRNSDNRTPTEERDHELINTIIDIIRDFFQDHTNVTVLEADGAEADDFIARWVQLHDQDGFEHVIVSADGDFKQLVTPSVELYNPMMNLLYTVDGVFHQDTIRQKPNEPVVQRHGETWRVKTDKHGVPERFDPKWELFVKCIRGDQSDSITAAWPHVYTSKMRAAYDGGVEAYNNFINSTWGKDGAKHSVRELYERNLMLIDLTQQPDEVQEILDEAILVAIGRERAKMTGAYFAKFCGTYHLNKLVKQADRYSYMLSRGYTE